MDEQRSGLSRLREGRYVPAVVAIAAVYFLTARFGLSLAFGPRPITAVWPPAGVALAAILLFGNRVWPAITLGAFFANLLTPDETVATAAAIAVGNTFEAYLGAFLLRRVGFRGSLTRVRDVLALVGLSALLSTAVGATLGVTALSGLLPQVHSWSQLPSNWLLWWVGDAMGVLIVAPVLLTLGDSTADGTQPGRGTEHAIAFFGLIGVSISFFASRSWMAMPGRQQEDVVFPFVLWAALRLGQRATAVASLCVSAIAIWGVTHGIGPFTGGSVNERLLLMHSFLAVLALTGLIVAAVAAERRRWAKERETALASAQTARTDAEERRAEIETLMDVMPVAVWIAHDAGCTRITGNRASRELLRGPLASIASEGEPGRRALGSHGLFRQDKDQSAEDLPLRYAASQGVEVRNRELELHFRDGTVADILGNASPLRDAAGNVRGSVATFLDISERKRAEEALRTEARRKDQFLALLAHELRNPLAPMRTATELLRMPRRTEAAAGRALDVIGRQITHMAHLIDDLLDVSRISHGKVLLRMQRLDLAKLAGAAAEEHGPVLAASGLILETKLPRTPVWVRGDATRLAQVIGNLLNNAAKFTPSGGRVTVEVTADLAEKDATLSVRDTGMGMEPGTIEWLFEPFAQADRSLDRSRGGLGLGLPLTRGLVELHGGRVSAASAGAGQGSVFSVSLPLSEVPDAAEAPPTSSSRHPRSLKVLVVEDNVDAAEMLELFLESHGHQVEVAHDGSAGLEAARSFRPEVVFCDIGLPGDMSGHDFAVAFRRDLSMQTALLVAMTGYGTSEDRQRTSEAGFDLHLTKPAAPADVERILTESVLRRSHGG